MSMIRIARTIVLIVIVFILAIDIIAIMNEAKKLNDVIPKVEHINSVCVEK